MKSTEFFDLCESVNVTGYYPILYSSLKVDGFSFRFGRNHFGDFFVETGKSGYIYDPQDFISFVESRTHTTEQLNRAKEYAKLFHILRDHFSDSIHSGTKVVCEILLNSLAEENNGRLKFVNLEYEKKYLGKILTVCIIDFISGTSQNTYEQIVDLFLLSSDDIKVYDSKLPGLVLDSSFTPILDTKSMNRSILDSRRAVDKQKKLEYNSILDLLKQSMANSLFKLLDETSSNFLGKTKEGFVVEFHGFGKYKITSPEFRKAMNDNRQSRIT